MDFLKLTEDKLSLDDVMNIVKSPKCGAVSFFAGTTRDNFDGLKVKELVYHAYEAMAYKTMKNVCVEIRKRWPEIENIAMYHRMGIVPVMETSVIIAISSPHRAESLAAVQYGIDALKATVPVWKKEEYEEGTAQWKENKECCWSSTTEMPKQIS
ncbi:molybdenum cofactor synthesis 2B [Lycorma delicatula]|uniref:molybdenum cofactor synthesis 2B n=1 Tax=Lycorma delicatula TaxID=130591 RepID=UPI003F517036